MNEVLQNILTACVPVISLAISAAGAYLVAYMKKKTAELEAKIENDTAAKYINMATEAVAQAVGYTAQTFVDALKADGSFTKEKQAEAFDKAKAKTLEILGEMAVDVLSSVYGDFDAWIETKIEQLCHQMKDTDKQVNSAAATTAAATAASVATTIATTAVQQLAAEVIAEQPADAQIK